MKYSDNFYASVALLKTADPFRIVIKELTEHLSELDKNNRVLNDVNLFRSQGRSQLLSELLEQFEEAEKIIAARRRAKAV